MDSPCTIFTISNLTEVEEYKMLQKIRETFPSISCDGSDLYIMNRYLLKIITKARTTGVRSYDADAELNELCPSQELARLKPEAKNKLKSFLIACQTLILDQNQSGEVQMLKLKDSSLLKVQFRDNEDFRLINNEEEWRNLLDFRNFLVVSLLVVKEKNKVLLEMAAGMLSRFNLCMSGGKPSRQVKRRHAIYHHETQTLIKPRRYNKASTFQSGDSDGEGRAKRRKVEQKQDSFSSYSSGSEGGNCFDPLSLLSDVALNMSQNFQCTAESFGKEHCSAYPYSPRQHFIPTLLLSEQ